MKFQLFGVAGLFFSCEMGLELVITLEFIVDDQCYKEHLVTSI